MISFIIPAYNEEQLLGRTLAALTGAARALSLLNDAFVRARAVEMARRMIGEGGDAASLAERAFELALSRLPSACERSAAIEFVESQTGRRQARDAGKPAAEVHAAAVADFCQTLFSTNEFLYID